jgi:hypothetical protein
MNRRQFGGRPGQRIGRAGDGGLCARGLLAQTGAARPFKLSVMLWTLLPKYTAEQAIDLAAGAGYDGFELVDEDKKW